MLIEKSYMSVRHTPDVVVAGLPLEKYLSQNFQQSETIKVFLPGIKSKDVFQARKKNLKFCPVGYFFLI